MAAFSRVALALIASAGVSSAFAQATPSASTVAQAAASPAPGEFAPRIGGGFTAFKDAETGALRSPTPAEMQALRALLPAMPSGAPVVEVAVPSGGFRVTLDASFDSFALMSRRPDGTLAFECVSPAEAAGAARAPAAATPVPRPAFQKTLVQFRQELPDVQ